MALVAGNEQGLIGHPQDIGDGGQPLALGHGFFQQGYHFVSPGVADHQPGPGGQQLFPVPLGQAPGDHHLGGGVLPQGPSHGVQALFVAGAGDGAGVYHVNVGDLGKIPDFIAGLLELFQHGLGIILIHLAAQGVEGHGAHEKILLFALFQIAGEGHEGDEGGQARRFRAENAPAQGDGPGPGLRQFPDFRRVDAPLRADDQGDIRLSR